MSTLSRQGRLEELVGLMAELNPGQRPLAITVTAKETGDRLRKIAFVWPVIGKAYISQFMEAVCGPKSEGSMGE